MRKYRPEFGGDERLDAVDIDVTNLRRILEQIADDGMASTVKAILPSCRKSRHLDTIARFFWREARP